MADFIDVPIDVTAEQIEEMAKRQVDTVAKKGSKNLITSGAVADVEIDSENILNDAVKNRHLAPDSVGALQVKNGAITEDKIAPGAVTSGKLAEKAVKTENLDTASVTGGKLADNAVNTGHIADGAVTGDKIENNTITKDKIKEKFWQRYSSVDIPFYSIEDLFTVINSLGTEYLLTVRLDFFANDEIGRLDGVCFIFRGRNETNAGRNTIYIINAKDGKIVQAIQQRDLNTGEITYAYVLDKITTNQIADGSVTYEKLGENVKSELLGDIDTALDNIIAIQNSYIGGAD